MPTRKYKTPAAARAARREKMSAYRRESYNRATYVTPPVRLDSIQAQALQKIMEAEQVGPAGAVRHALVTTAAMIRGAASRSAAKANEKVVTPYGRVTLGCYDDFNEIDKETLATLQRGMKATMARTDTSAAKATTRRARKRSSTSDGGVNR